MTLLGFSFLCYANAQFTTFTCAGYESILTFTEYTTVFITTNKTVTEQPTSVSSTSAYTGTNDGLLTSRSTTTTQTQSTSASTVENNQTDDGLGGSRTSTTNTASLGTATNSTTAAAITTSTIPSSIIESSSSSTTTEDQTTSTSSTTQIDGAEAVTTTATSTGSTVSSTISTTSSTASTTLSTTSVISFSSTTTASQVSSQITTSRITTSTTTPPPTLITTTSSTTTTTTTTSSSTVCSATVSCWPEDTGPAPTSIVASSTDCSESSCNDEAWSYRAYQLCLLAGSSCLSYGYSNSRAYTFSESAQRFLDENQVLNSDEQSQREFCNGPIITISDPVCSAPTEPLAASTTTLTSSLTTTLSSITTSTSSSTSADTTTTTTTTDTLIITTTTSTSTVDTTTTITTTTTDALTTTVISSATDVTTTASTTTTTTEVTCATAITDPSSCNVEGHYNMYGPFIYDDTIIDDQLCKDYCASNDALSFAIYHDPVYHQQGCLCYTHTVEENTVAAPRTGLFWFDICCLIPDTTTSSTTTTSTTTTTTTTTSTTICPQPTGANGAENGYTLFPGSFFHGTTALALTVRAPNINTQYCETYCDGLQGCAVFNFSPRYGYCDFFASGQCFTQGQSGDFIGGIKQ